MRTPYWSLQKLAGGAGAAGRPRIERAAAAPSAGRGLPVLAAGDVAGRVDVRDDGAGALVDRHAVARQRRAGEPARLGRDADADEHGVGGDRPAVGEHELLRPARPPTAGRASATDDAELDAHALGSVQVGEPAAEPRAEHVRERDLGRLDQRDLDAEAARGGGDLLADEAGADDRQPRARRERRAQRRPRRRACAATCTFGRPANIGSRRGAAAGGDDQLVVAERRRRPRATRAGAATSSRAARRPSSSSTPCSAYHDAAGTRISRARRAAPWRAAGGRRERPAPRTRPGWGRGGHGRAASRPRAGRRARRRR